MKTLYFDCFAGASGNMILGGLVSLGVSSDQLKAEIGKLNINDFEIDFTEADRSGINSVHVKTIYKEETKHRHLSNIQKIIDDTDLSASVKKRSIAIFRNLAAAEAQVHGTDIEKVHFHEVGAMDAIIDVVGACVGFEILGIEKFICSKIHTGSGFIEIAHGKYPIPPPAVAELLKGIPIYSSDIEGELITPTGAAIISTLCEEFGALPEMTIEKTGYGAGTREYKNFPNTLRMFVGDISPQSHGDSEKKSFRAKDQKPKTEALILIETNLDDVSPEILGHVMEKSFEIGALDCWFTPIQMKKNRPATMITILCESQKKEELSALLFLETTTLGVRINEIERHCLPREEKKMQTEFGEVSLKVARYNGKIVNVKPEFDWLREVSGRTGLSVSEITSRVLISYKQNTEGN